MSRGFSLGKSDLDTRILVQLASAPSPKIEVDDSVWKNLEKKRAFVEKAAAGTKEVYGINTGFGYLAKVKIKPNEVSQLQVNLIRSHACGVGAPMELTHARAMLILKTHNFLQGMSGVSRPLVETMLKFIEHDIIPVIPRKGSVGASGDLAPLSHLALGLMGEGHVFYKGERRPAKEVLEQLKVKPHQLQAKEGLALANGTQFMTALGAFIVEHTRSLLKSADAIAAMSLDALRGSIVAYDPRIHESRGQAGQMTVAKNLLSLFQGKDEIMESHVDCDKVQDPYSLRCVPQVHGACRDVFGYVEGVINRELNGATDNPLVMDNGDILSGGNFHGQPVAFALDIVVLSLAEIGSISERRIEKLTNPNMSGLPAFLVKNEGLNSGFMIPHVVAASLVSENKIYAHPASVDSIPTSADKEDHVSMGPIAAYKALSAIENLSHILAIETLSACQGLDILAPLKPAKALQTIHGAVRALSAGLEGDRYMADDIDKMSKWLLDNGLEKALVASGLRLE